MAFDPNKISEKYKTNATAARKDFIDGIKGVTESPTAKAADKIDKMKAGLMAAFDSGFTEAQLRKVTLAEWKEAAQDPAKWLEGISKKGAEGQKKFWQSWGPILETHKNEIAQLTDDTLEDRLQKMMANAREMAKLKGTWRR